jgi:amino acid transporter
MGVWKEFNKMVFWTVASVISLSIVIGFLALVFIVADLMAGPLPATILILGMVMFFGSLLSIRVINRHDWGEDH